ncbi:acyl-CoA dehydrogenase family protein [Nocardia sp. NPDC051321]|uniref:acyl-CoA dehydrogenase family protein n=1 Tax=Nocardia sp. NPDC051321 TaxID=3364323 RepID=UPI00378A7D93
MKILPHTILTDIEDLSLRIARQAEDIEKERRVPDALLDELRRAGCLRLLVPAEYDGAQLPLPDALRVVETLARADAATAWLVGQVGLADLIVSCFPQSTTAEFYAAGPDVMGAGAVAPKGRLTKEPDGYRVNGQWPFVTGCEQASWIYLNGVVVADRKVQTTQDGMPQTRIALLPAGAVEIIDTWNVVGLCGTASHDVQVSDIGCAAARTTGLDAGNPEADRITARIAQSGLIIAAVIVGIARGALDDIVTLARGGKRPAFSRSKLADSPLFQDRLGEAHMQVSAAAALLYTAAEQSEHSWARRQPMTALARAGLQATPARVAELAGRAVDTAYNLGGGSVVYQSSPLQRRLRDVKTAGQHFVCERQFYSALGGELVQGGAL